MGTVVVAVIASGAAAVLTLVLVLLGASAAVRWWSTYRGGLAADGVVVPSQSAGTRTADGEHAVLAEFRTPDGQCHRVRLSSPWLLHPGTQVTVRYPAGRPEGAVLESASR